MFKHKIRAFTLVELIVVITILAILATISFLSFQNYSKTARDSSRVTSIKEIQKGLSLSLVQNRNYQMPDSYITIGGFGYQGYAGSGTLLIAKVGASTQDPYDRGYYVYAISEDKKRMQLGTYLEEKNPTYFSYINNSFADIDYSNRYLYTIGDNFGVLTDCTTKAPLQSYSTGIADLGSYASNLMITLSDNSGFCGTGSQVLSKIPSTGNCVLGTTFILGNCNL